MNKPINNALMPRALANAPESAAMLSTLDANSFPQAADPRRGCHEGDGIGLESTGSWHLVQADQTGTTDGQRDTVAGLVPLLVGVVLLAAMNTLLRIFDHGFLRVLVLVAALAGVGMMFFNSNNSAPVTRTGCSLPRGPLPYITALAAMLAALTPDRQFDWRAGITPFAWFGVVGVGMAAILAHCWLRRQTRDAAIVAGVFLVVAIALVGLQLSRQVAWSAVAAERTGHLRLDEGRTTLRAINLLWRGENPYGQGVIVDDTAFLKRLPQRYALGIAPALPGAEVEAQLERYLATRDPALARLLLPDTPGASLRTRSEAAFLGYKYGPVPLLLSAAPARWLGPSAIPVGNSLATFALFATMALILRHAGIGWLVTGLVVLSLMTDPIMVQYFLRWTATDIWPLLFGFLAVLATMRRSMTAAGVLLAFSVASKVAPGVLFLLLLPICRSWRMLGACGVTGLLVALPWLAWDPLGFVANFVLWGLVMAPEYNAWIYHVAPFWPPVVRAGLLVLIVALAFAMATGRLRQTCVGFAALTLLVLIGGSANHSNYIPWASTWMLLALVETYHAPGAISHGLAFRPVTGGGRMVHDMALARSGRTLGEAR